jgi:hypothetical protein
MEGHFGSWELQQGVLMSDVEYQYPLHMPGKHIRQYKVIGSYQKYGEEVSNKQGPPIMQHPK